MKSHERKRFAVLLALSAMTTLMVGIAHQAVAGSCKKLTPSSACAHTTGGMGANCGTWSCPHQILVNHSLNACANARPDEEGRASCVPGDLAFCSKQLSVCGPEFTCILTGTWIEESIPNAVLAGVPCFG